MGFQSFVFFLFNLVPNNGLLHLRAGFQKAVPQGMSLLVASFELILGVRLCYCLLLVTMPKPLLPNWVLDACQCFLLVVRCEFVELPCDIAPLLFVFDLGVEPFDVAKKASFIALWLWLCLVFSAKGASFSLTPFAEFGFLGLMKKVFDMKV